MQMHRPPCNHCSLLPHAHCAGAPGVSPCQAVHGTLCSPACTLRLCHWHAAGNGATLSTCDTTKLSSCCLLQVCITRAVQADGSAVQQAGGPTSARDALAIHHHPLPCAMCHAVHNLCGQQRQAMAQACSTPITHHLRQQLVPLAQPVQAHCNTGTTTQRTYCYKHACT
jgi:hypothetical protein